MFPCFWSILIQTLYISIIHSFGGFSCLTLPHWLSISRVHRTLYTTVHLHQNDLRKRKEEKRSKEKKKTNSTTSNITDRLLNNRYAPLSCPLPRSAHHRLSLTHVGSPAENDRRPISLSGEIRKKKEQERKKRIIRVTVTITITLYRLTRLSLLLSSLAVFVHFLYISASAGLVHRDSFSFSFFYYFFLCSTTSGILHWNVRQSSNNAGCSIVQSGCKSLIVCNTAGYSFSLLSRHRSSVSSKAHKPVNRPARYILPLRSTYRDINEDKGNNNPSSPHRHP